METSLTESQTDSYFPTKWPNGYPKQKDTSDTRIQRQTLTKLNHDRRTALERSVKSISMGLGRGGGGGRGEGAGGVRGALIDFTCPQSSPLLTVKLQGGLQFCLVSHKGPFLVHCCSLCILMIFPSIQTP